MRIIDQKGNEIQETDVDLSIGYLCDHFILRPGVPEVDFETKHLYEDGDFEQVKLFVISNDAPQRRIAELKERLRQSDYHILKVVEGAKTLSECAEIIRQRTLWRREINTLEKSKEE